MWCNLKRGCDNAGGFSQRWYTNHGQCLSLITSQLYWLSTCFPFCRCELWVWCDQEGGCDDAGDYASSAYPHHGCQLMQLAKRTEPEKWDRGPVLSSFQSGYLTGAPTPGCSPI